MPRQIIVLEQTPANNGYNNLKVVFWYPIPIASQVPKLNFQSAVDNALAGPDQVSNGELALLQSGAILEEVSILTLPANFTQQQLQIYLQASYTARAAYIASISSPIQYYGASYDGNAWTK